MSAKPDSEIAQSQQLSTLTIHETSSPIHIKLDGSSYRVWSQVLEMHIAGKKKKGYITVRKAASKESDSSYDEWEAEAVMTTVFLIKMNAYPYHWLSNSFEDVFTFSQYCFCLKSLF